MAASIEVAGSSDSDRVERFADLWWDDVSSSATVDPAPVMERSSTVVIHAERV